MAKQPKTAILLGATGLTGGHLLRLLLEDGRYSQIRLFSRRAIGFEHPKLVEFIGDLKNLASFKKDFAGNVVFCCIGTTKAKTPDKDAYRTIDLGIPVAAAELCKQNGIDTFVVLSALGADSKSAIFYNRVKGEMQDAVQRLGLTKTHIMQPSLIGGDRTEKRTGEWLGKLVMKGLDRLLVGPLKKYRTIHPQTIAKAMVWVANHQVEKQIIKSDEIFEIAAR
ncbi:NAD(P)H-binding protein [Maribacter sp. 2-571]|uniref:NAD(P)H-binding protein n=1 Tax=Maribacter sp. 2-571 TaxID=3417569 RepID=UPI003D359877